MARGWVHTIRKDGEWVNEVEGSLGVPWSRDASRDAAVDRGKHPDAAGRGGQPAVNPPSLLRSTTVRPGRVGCASPSRRRRQTRRVTKKTTIGATTVRAR